MFELGKNENGVLIDKMCWTVLLYKVDLWRVERWGEGWICVYRYWGFCFCGLEFGREG